MRNGPGMFEVGDTHYHHWFDGLALVHSFTILNGKLYHYSAIGYSYTQLYTFMCTCTSTNVEETLVVKCVLKMLMGEIVF